MKLRNLTIQTMGWAMLTFTIFIFAQCKGVQSRLVDIDSLIQTNVDSACLQLIGIETEMEHANNPDKAYYHLLCAKAEDKAGMKHTNDSLIQWVVTSLEEEDAHNQLVQAYYYAGRFKQDMEQNEKALYYYQLALMSDTTQLDASLQSNIYMHTGEIYQRNGLLDDAKSMYELAIYFSQQCGDTLSSSMQNKAIGALNEIADTMSQEVKMYKRQQIRYINQRVNTYLLQRQNLTLQNDGKEGGSHLPLILCITICITIPLLYIHSRRKRAAKAAAERAKADNAAHSSTPTPEEEETKSQPIAKRQFFDDEVNHIISTRLQSDKTLSSADWKLIEERLLTVFPNYRSSLFSLYNMSETEYRICLLIKLEVSPSHMARLMAMSNSSISQSRLRMQQKVFNGKGTAKDWDKYILSL